MTESIKTKKGNIIQSGNDKSFSVRKEVFDLFEIIVVSLIIVVLLFTFVIRQVGVEGASMENTLHNNDRLIISHMFYEPKQGDIVVIDLKESFDQPIIKRVIAVEGQTLDIDSNTGKVYVDGEALDEPYVKGHTYKYIHGTNPIKETYPIKIPKGKVFVLGDNREHSTDSRAEKTGLVDKNNILGKAVFRLFPFNKMGTIG